MSQESEPRRSGRPTRRSDSVAAIIGQNSGALEQNAQNEQPSATSTSATSTSTGATTTSSTITTTTPAQAAPEKKRHRRSKSDGDLPTGARVSNLVANSCPYDVILCDSLEVEKERVLLGLEEMRVVAEGLARMAKIEAHFEILILWTGIF